MVASAGCAKGWKLSQRQFPQFSDPGKKEGTHFWWGIHKKRGKRIGATEQLSFTKPWQQHCLLKASAKQRPPSSANSASTQAAGQLSDELRPFSNALYTLPLRVGGARSKLTSPSPKSNRSGKLGALDWRSGPRERVEPEGVLQP